jgi:NADH:ubiquinone oxidoreductase subunit 5 (subunit L)/multisubunit Na+/H+ antiporter MnhA subunit
LAAIGILLAYRKYGNGLPDTEKEEPTRGVRGLLYNRYHVTEMIYEPMGHVASGGVAAISNLFDRKIIDGAVNQIADKAQGQGSWMRKWQDGNLTTYMASIAIGAAILLGIVTQLVLRWWP